LADKDFKVKNKLFVNGLSNASGVILATNNNLDSSTTLPTQYGGTGTTTSPNAGQIPYSSSGTNYAPTDLSSLTISSSGGSTITAASASTKGLIIKGAASQSANLQEWQDSSGTAYTYIGSPITTGQGPSIPLVFSSSGVGQIKWGNNTVWSIGLISGQTNVMYPYSYDRVALIVKGVSSQTGDLQQWRQSNDTVGTKIGSYGELIGSNLLANSIGPTISGVMWGVTAGLSSYVPVVIRGAASQTADLQQWQNSAGTVNARIDAYGTFQNGTASGYGAWINVQPKLASDKGIIIRGAASQSADLQQWQDSAGTVLASISATGKITSSVDASINGITIGLGSATSASRNIAIGLYAGESFGANDQNIAVGYASGRYNYGADNVFVGTLAGVINGGGGGNNNVYLGTQSGYSGVGSGNIMIGYQAGQNTSGSNKLVIANSNTSTPLIGGDFSAKTLTFAGNVTVTSQATGTVGITVKGADSQTADLQQFQGSTGTVLAKINQSGFYFGPGLRDINNNGSYINLTASGTILVGTQSTTIVPITVRGLASQTANLQEWQNSSGTANAAISSSGDYLALNGTLLRASTASVYGSLQLQDGGTNQTILNPYTAGLLINNSGVTGMTVVRVRGASGQTANLQEWQNSSGTVLASISAAGNLTVQDITVNGTTTTINSTTLTVDDKNIELASVASPTDTTADGAGITIKGATDKTFNWVQSTGAFTSSEPIYTPALSVSGNSVSSNITLAAGKRYFVDTTSARTLTLPASPTLADTIEIYDASGAAATNNITVNSNSGKINGTVQDLTVDTNGAAFSLVYTGSTYGWVVR
jgi:hypothetical protein